jgi:hypothetical protein
VETRGGCPARIFFRGRRGEVLAASGPWRSSGEWWGGDAWQQEEWDLEIRFVSSQSARATDASATREPPAAAGGLYRFVYDQRRGEWLVRGVYD